jgi:phosphomannomutase
MYKKFSPKSSLEKLFFDGIEKDTPQNVKDFPLIDLSNKNAFSFVLKKGHLLRNTNDPKPLEKNEERSPEGLALNDWLKNYEKEAKASTAGIRGIQNPLYPWDTRYPLNLVGVALATLGKALVAKETFGAEINNLKKIAACEVRYNSQLYVDLISRVQAAQGIKTYRAPDCVTMPIWMISFLTLVLDFYGAEYVTSSHAISKKIATKDINFQGSQYIPEESIKFVNKIKEVFKIVEDSGEYVINFSTSDDKNIDTNFLQESSFGVDLYVEYLKKAIATSVNIDLIKSAESKIIIECMGGSMFKPLSLIFERFGINSQYEFFNKDEDPFFHNIGKSLKDNVLSDLSCDSTIVNFKDNSLPVIETMDYKNKLKNYPVGTLLLMTDPDGDRLATAQIESIENKNFLQKVGINFSQLDDSRVLAVYMPNQSFLMNMDFQMKALKKANLWDQYNWFIIKTTPSAMSWDEWAHKNNVAVVNTPVGYKEIATIMQKVEAKMFENSGQDVIIDDIFGNQINLGKSPRLLFGGEESGGEILGPSELIKSSKGRQVISVREKSAGEAIVITSAMYSDLQKKGQTLSTYLQEIFDSNQIFGRFDVRVDKKYYNENEPDISKLKESKESGILIRTKNDMYFLSIALLCREGKLRLEQVKEILAEAFSELNFEDLENIFFVGDGTYLRFKTKYVEVRPSGTDAINKAYAAGNDKTECLKYADLFASYLGDRNSKHKDLIPNSFYERVKELSLSYLTEYQTKDLPNIKYSI